MRVLAAVAVAVAVGSTAGWALGERPAAAPGRQQPEPALAIMKSVLDRAFEKPPAPPPAPDLGEVDPVALRNGVHSAMSALRRQPCFLDARARFRSAHRDYVEAWAATMTPGGQPGAQWRTSSDQALSAAIWKLRADGFITDGELHVSSLNPAYAKDAMARIFMAKVQIDEDRAAAKPSEACQGSGSHRTRPAVSDGVGRSAD